MQQGADKPPMGPRALASVTVGIPTFARGTRVFGVLERLAQCDPAPAETIVHVDASDGVLERELAKRFPSVKRLSSAIRIGPGGGRDRCIRAATQPYFASFDDDSWPLDSDYFAEVVRNFEMDSRVGLLSAINIHPWEPYVPKCEHIETVVEFAGCGFALRCAAYTGISGYIDRPWAYNAEEVDLALQLHAADWLMARVHGLRVYHDTQLAHHESAHVTAATIQNVALICWLRYPLCLWPHGMLQVANIAIDRLRRRRWRGMASGLLGIPWVTWQYRNRRRRLPAKAIRDLWAKRCSVRVAPRD